MAEITDVAPGLSTQPAPAEPPARFGLTGWLRWGWRTLTSMRTALILLFLLALAAIPGSVLPQRALNELRVMQFYKDHPHLAPILNRLSMFGVFHAWWFAAIYLALFLSLAGCVIPRSWQHARAIRARPPAPPRRLDRLPETRTWQTGLTIDAAYDAFAGVFRQRRFRLDRHPTGLAAGERGRFDAHVRSRPQPGAAWRTDDIRSNHPLKLGETKIYLVGHGYAPHFVIRDDPGQVVFDGAAPFLPQDGNFDSTGVVKVPDARPQQLGFSGFFAPTAVPSSQGFVSVFPGAKNPAVVLLAFRGNLGLDSGVPQ